MSETKHISLKNLQAFLKPLMRIINRKAESWEDLKNRPFGSEYKQVDLISNISCTIDGDYQKISNNIYFNVGQTYTVIYNGIQYECVAWRMSTDCVCIGNGDIYGGSGMGNGEPFSCDSYEDGSCYINIQFDGTHTISISTVDEIVTKLPSKYINMPNGILTADNYLQTTAGMQKGNGEVFNNYDGNSADGYMSHAEGSGTQADGEYSHAEGLRTRATGENSHAEGYQTEASNDGSHAEGCETTASGRYSHVEGFSTIASGVYQHVQGKYNMENDTYAHIVGNGKNISTNPQYITIQRSNAHTLDWNGNAWYSGDVYVGSTSGTNKDEGSKKLATESYVDEKIETIEVPVNSVNSKTGEVVLTASDIGAMSVNNPVGTGSFSMGRSNNTTIGECSYAMGNDVVATGENSHAEGRRTVANGNSSHAEGGNTKADASCSHAEGNNTKANADYSHAEGFYTVADGENSHAEGYNTKAIGENSHAEGYLTTANGKSSHAEGDRTKANSYYSHAEGYNTIANANSSHAEGSSTIAFGNSAHSEGQGSRATIQISGEANSLTYNIVNESDLEYVTIYGIILLDNISAVITAIDETNLTITLSNTLSSEVVSNASVLSFCGGIAYGTISHTEGKDTIATASYQHVQGRYNIVDTRKQYAHIVGNGYSDSKSNAHTLDWNGNAWFAGDVYVGSTSGK